MFRLFHQFTWSALQQFTCMTEYIYSVDIYFLISKILKQFEGSVNLYLTFLLFNSDWNNLIWSISYAYFKFLRKFIKILKSIWDHSQFLVVFLVFSFICCMLCSIHCLPVGNLSLAKVLSVYFRLTSLTDPLVSFASRFYFHIQIYWCSFH